MIITLKQSIRFVVKICPDVSINGYCLKTQIDDCIFKLKDCGFNVRAVVADNHAANVSVFNELLSYEADDNLFIRHLAYHEWYLL